MSSAKKEILKKIQRALPSSAPQREDEYRTMQREYPVAGSLDVRSRLDLIEERLADYDAGVYHCAESQIPQTIASILSARNKRSLVIPSGLPREWLPEGFSFAVDDGLSYEQLDQSEGVLTGCSLAIAVTGTIVLRHSEIEGRRALTLIPDYHLCVVRSEQVVETVPEGIRAMAQFATSPLTTISGPSATSDIEMTRVKGVHGPRVLDVILVEG